MVKFERKTLRKSDTMTKPLKSDNNGGLVMRTHAPPFRRLRLPSRTTANDEGEWGQQESPWAKASGKSNEADEYRQTARLQGKNTVAGEKHSGWTEDSESVENGEGGNMARGSTRKSRTSRAVLRSFACVWSSTCVPTVCTPGLPAKRRHGVR